MSVHDIPGNSGPQSLRACRQLCRLPPHYRDHPSIQDRQTHETCRYCTTGIRGSAAPVPGVKGGGGGDGGVYSESYTLGAGRRRRKREVWGRVIREHHDGLKHMCLWRLSLHRYRSRPIVSVFVFFTASVWQSLEHAPFCSWLDYTGDDDDVYCVLCYRADSE